MITAPNQALQPTSGRRLSLGVRPQALSGRSSMKDPAAKLITPFGKIWKDLAAQANAWGTVNRLISLAISLPKQLEEVRASLDDGCLQAKEKIDGALSINAKEMASKAGALLLTQREAIVYPGLVGAWAIVEASFDDLMRQILAGDSDVEARLKAIGVKTTVSHPAGSDEWVDTLYRRLENKAKVGSGGRVVEIHRSCLAVFGIPFEYPADRSRVIEELNQVRNSILHSQGVITGRAVEISPRLSQYLGLAIPADDPVFTVAMTLLHDYTTAWIASLIHSPYLRTRLLPEAVNPFSPQAIAAKLPK